MGHWLSWKLQGGKTGGIEIIKPFGAAPKGASTIIFDWPINCLNDVANFTRARIITLWSGVYAQAFNGNSYDTELIKKEFGAGGGGRLDWLKADEYLFFLSNLLGRTKTLECLHDEIDQEAATLVANNFEIINNISMKISMVVKNEGDIYYFHENEIESMMI